MDFERICEITLLFDWRILIVECDSIKKETSQSVINEERERERENSSDMLLFIADHRSFSLSYLNMSSSSSESVRQRR